LGLLSDLAAGKWPQGIEAVLAMTERLKDELPMMLAEHVAILAALEKLAEAARIAGSLRASKPPRARKWLKNRFGWGTRI